MKDCDSRRSWIGGEGLPSRDLGQRKRENSRTTEGSTCHGTVQVFWNKSCSQREFQLYSHADSAGQHVDINVTSRVVVVHDCTTGLATDQASQVFDVLCLFSIWAIFPVREPL
jgi:hypothetical protein